MVIQLRLAAYAERTFIPESGGSGGSPYTKRMMSDYKTRPLAASTSHFRSLIVTVLSAWAAGERFDNAKWTAMVTAEPGADARGRFERPILHGTDTLDPRSDMFGACFRRPATTFDKNAKAIAGYRWVRTPSIPDLRP